METIISIIIGCISIGIIVSAPMGPVGILCVQRTLNKGRNSGFFTGVGASISDIIYCLLTGLGMSIVTDFIEANQSILQIIGSIILAIYAIYLIKHNPVSRIKEPTEKKENFTQDLITGFLFTFSNPLIIFLIIPLFARFNFPSTDYKYYHILLGYICIVLGALFWWYVITFLVDKVRSHFNIRSLWLINRIMGSVIIILSLYGFIMGVVDYLKIHPL